MAISTQPYKGARDFYPEDMLIRNYMTNVMREVCLSYGYEEYDFPIMEPFEIFAAKTGEEIVNEQLYSLIDRGNRKLAIRPELTPGTVRMIAQKVKELTTPIRWFMIGNNWRAEKPQKGRGREFYQLEVNMFGVETFEADTEIFSVIIDIMKKFGADDTMFGLSFSDRRLINALLLDTLKLSEEESVKVRRMMDKRAKMPKEVFLDNLKELGLDSTQATKIEDFMNTTLENLGTVIPQEILDKNKGYLNIKGLVELLKSRDIYKYCKFDPSIIRGFDYSDGLVYEVFDRNPDNNRSMFGGERFDKLIEIFGEKDMPATGFAMGDWTLLEFLKSWKLLPELSLNIDYIVTRFPGRDSKYDKVLQNVATTLRGFNKNVVMWITDGDKMDKQLKNADKKDIRKAILIGEQELKDGKIIIKDLKTREQEVKSLEKCFSEIE